MLYFSSCLGHGARLQSRPVRGLSLRTFNHKVPETEAMLVQVWRHPG